MTEPAFEVRWGAATDAGVRRSENQDASLVQPPVFVVADGMGGHQAGRDAADLVVRAFRETSWAPWVTPQALNQATATADLLVRELADQVGGAPGSTLSGVGLACHDGSPSWLVFNIGDSRTYLLRGDVLERITVDHSQLQALLDQGLDEAAARERARSNVITRAIGGGLRDAPQPDQWLVPAAPDDRILICSDGLTGELSDPLVTALLLAHKSPLEAARELVEAAVRSGGRDNVTAVVVDATVVVGRPLPGHDDDPEDTVDSAGGGALDDDTRPDLAVVTG